MRTGSNLLQVTKPFAQEDTARSWRYLLEALALWGMLTFGVVASPWWPVKVALAVVLGLLQIRIFILYHDHLHGAILRKSPVARAIFSSIGFFLLSVRSVWKETHNYHHKNNAKMVGSTIGSYPILSVGMYKALDSKRKRAYRMARHPAIIFFGYIPVFMIGMCLLPFSRNVKAHWVAPVALLIHVAMLVALGFWIGLVNVLCAIIVPMLITFGLGAYLFYAQHNFPDAQLRGRRDWDYTHAALRCSSFFEMSPLMHWFTGNIGYHHVHHLNHRIPFYRLPEAMAAIPELQTPGRTSWRWRDVKACLSLAAWDPKENRMVTWSAIGES